MDAMRASEELPAPDPWRDRNRPRPDEFEDER
jgi:hypothetical protein